MIDTTDAAAWSGPDVLPGQGDHQLDQPRGWARTLEQVVPLAQKYGAALIVGCIDEDKVRAGGHRASASSRSPAAPALLTEKYGVAAPRTSSSTRSSSPAATGDKNYVGQRGRDDRGHAADQGGASRRRKTILGISNVSLRAARRRAARCSTPSSSTTASKAGLDLAIVNSEKLERYAVDPRGGAEARRGPALQPRRGSRRGVRRALPRRRSRGARRDGDTLSLDERLAALHHRGHEGGSHRGPRGEARRTPPLDIINGPLMKGMDEVGRLFNANELIVAEVLQSAESMKAAVTHLEQFMEKATAPRARAR